MEIAYNHAQSIRRTGFIAQQVEKAATESDYDFSGIIKPKSEKEHYSLSYESFVAPLVKAVQEQQSIIKNQDERIKVQDQEMRQLKLKLAELTKAVQKLFDQQ